MQPNCQQYIYLLENSVESSVFKFKYPDDINNGGYIWASQETSKVQVGSKEPKPSSLDSQCLEVITTPKLEGEGD